MTDGKKRTQTSYGTVEYDTVQCEECTNHTVESEITHVYAVESTEEEFRAGLDDVTAHAVCTGCIDEQYDFEGEVLDIERLREFYEDQNWAEKGEIDPEVFVESVRKHDLPNV